MTQDEYERPKYRPFQHSDWRTGLVKFLISAGTTGRKQHVVIERFHLAADADTIVNHLEALRIERKVDKFQVKTKGRPATFWRATTLILEDDDE